MSETTPKRRKRRVEEPLEVRLTLAFRFGDDRDDVVTIMDNRAIPMVDSVFQNRDRILRGFVYHLLRAGVSQPKVVQQVVPALKLLKRGGKRG